LGSQPPNLKFRAVLPPVALNYNLASLIGYSGYFLSPILDRNFLYRLLGRFAVRYTLALFATNSPSPQPDLPPLVNDSAA
jgi:hypothetical protein